MGVRRMFRRCLLVLMAIALLSGCSGGAEQVQPQPVTAELARLVSQVNGLYYPPYLQNAPATVEDTSYALQTMSLLGESPRLTADAATVDRMRAEALEVSPLWGRWWLANLTQYSTTALLAAADVAAVKKMRGRDGSYADPQNPPEDTAGRIAATAAALHVLRIGRAAPENAAGTAAWLRSVCPKQSAAQPIADCREAAQAVGARLPSPKNLQPPAVDFAVADPDERYQQLILAYSYVQAAVATGVRPELQRADWQKLLTDNVTDLGFKDLYFAAVVGRAAGVDASALQQVRTRLDQARLPDGAVRDLTALQGSARDTFDGLSVRSRLGESTTDPQLVTALRADPADQDDPLDAATRAAGRRLAGDPAGAADLRKACDALAAGLPTLTADTAAEWERATLVCDGSGTVLPIPTTANWNRSGAEGLEAAATAVVGVHRLRAAVGDGAGGAAPRGLATPADLRPWLTRPATMPTTGDYLTVVTAYLLAGGKLDQASTSAVTGYLAAAKGCPGLPDLYRIAADQGCDLGTTVRAIDLQALLTRSG